LRNEPKKRFVFNRNVKRQTEIGDNDPGAPVLLSISRAFGSPLTGYSPAKKKITRENGRESIELFFWLPFLNSTF
jgi:hypothetical protein